MAPTENPHTAILPRPTGAGVMESPSKVGIAHQKMLARLLSLRVPRIVGEADGADLRALSDYLVAVADAVDPLVEAVGLEAKSNCPGAIDLNLFRRQVFAALDGNALCDLHAGAERIDEIASAAMEMWVP